MRTQDSFDGYPQASAVFEKVRAVVDKVGAFDVLTTRSLVALCRRCGFAYIWMPGRYLRKLNAEVVLSIAPSSCRRGSPDSSPDTRPRPAVRGSA